MEIKKLDLIKLIRDNYVCSLPEAQEALERVVSPNEMLRDKFAMAALAGMVAKSGSLSPSQSLVELVVRDAFFYADEMLKQRVRDD